MRDVLAWIIITFIFLAAIYALKNKEEISQNGLSAIVEEIWYGEDGDGGYR